MIGRTSEEHNELIKIVDECFKHYDDVTLNIIHRLKGLILEERIKSEEKGIADFLKQLTKSQDKIWAAGTGPGGYDIYIRDGGEDRHIAEEHAYEHWENNGCPDDDPPVVYEFVLINIHEVEYGED